MRLVSDMAIGEAVNYWDEDNQIQKVRSSKEEKLLGETGMLGWLRAHQLATCNFYIQESLSAYSLQIKCVS